MEIKDFIITQLGITDTQRALLDLAHISGSFHTKPRDQKEHENNPDLPLTPYYFSGKSEDIMPGYELAVPFLSALAIIEHLGDDLEYQLVAGIPNSGTEIARIVSKITGIPFIELEKEVLKDGRRRISPNIKGVYRPGQRVLGIENVVAHGNSGSEFLYALGDSGLLLPRLVSAYSRREGGLERLNKAGVDATSVLSSDVVAAYYRWGVEPAKLSYPEYDEIMRFIEERFLRLV